MAKKGSKTKVGSDKDDVVAAIPMACCDETAAVEFMEQQRWGDKPRCARCDSENVYKMIDAKTGDRNKRFLWRCHDCKEQYTVRIGTVMEESRIPLRHWCYAFWRACTSKKGVAALEIKRHTGLSYTSALFLMHRIREAMACTDNEPLTGEIEADEVWVGGKTKSGRQRITNKTPVLVLVQRNGKARLKSVARVTAKNVHAHIVRNVNPAASSLYSDELKAYRGIGEKFAGGHRTVMHSIGEYYRHADKAGINAAESINAIIKRGLHGIYHSVSKHHLHRYLCEFQFRWDNRKASDGERVKSAIAGAVGKRLVYREPLTRHQGK